MPRLRVEKLQERIRQEVSSMLLLDVKDPRVKNVVVTSVEVSNDLAYAKIYVSIYGTPEEQENCLVALRKAQGYLRTEIAQRIRLRVAPQLLFAKDNSYEYGEHIESILKSIKEEGQENV